jgi:hypothetical protein
MSPESMISSRKADACNEVADGINKAGGDAIVVDGGVTTAAV